MFQINIMCPEVKALNETCPGPFYAKAFFESKEVESRNSYWKRFYEQKTLEKHESYSDVMSLIESSPLIFQIKSQMIRFISAEKKVDLDQTCELANQAGLISSMKAEPRQPPSAKQWLSAFNTWDNLQKNGSELAKLLTDLENFPKIVRLLMKDSKELGDKQVQAALLSRDVKIKEAGAP